MLTPLWVVLFVSVIWDTAYLQPTSKDGKKECCPCPKDGSGSSLARSSIGDDSLAYDQDTDGTSVEGMRAAAGGCPCQLRDADSVGAPSVFFPSAVRAVRPFVNLEDSKENPDPLLHPEVNLASSVLETLRKATDEEYEEALARDAARSAADGEAAESARNLVTVIINPKESIDDDIMSEASHVHETRCIDPPIGRSSLRSSYKPSILLTDILHLPKRKPNSLRSWSLFDMDSGAAPSNVNERVVEPSFKMDEIEPTPTSKPDTKLQSSLDKLLPRIPDLTNHKKADLTFKEEQSDFKSTPVANDAKPRTSIDKLLSKIPDLTSNLHKERSNLNPVDSLLPKLRTPPKIEIPSIPNLLPRLNAPNLQRNNDENGIKDSLDSQNAASIIKERYTGFIPDKIKGDSVMEAKPIQPSVIPSFKSSIPDFKIESKPIDLKNILSEKRDAASDLLNNLLKGLEVPNLSNLFSSDLFNSRNNDLGKSTVTKASSPTQPEIKPYVTEILDTVPSASEIKKDHISFNEVESEGGINKNMNTENEDQEQKIIEQNPMKTQILDFIPSSSDINEIDREQEQALQESDGKAKVNTVSSSEDSEINNEMEEINRGDIIDDTIINASNRDDQSENFSSPDNIDDDVNRDHIDLDAPEKIDLEKTEDNQRDNTPFINAENENISLRDRIRNTLENLKARSKLKVDSKPIVSEEIEDEPSISTFESQDEEPGKVTTQILDNLPEQSSLDQVNTEDLQQMSDSLLEQEKQRIESSGGNASEENTNIKENDANSLEEPLETENRELIKGNSEDSNIPDNKMMETRNPDVVSSDNDNKNACLETAPSSNRVPDPIRNENIGETSGVSAKNNEMMSEASERIMNTVDVGDKLRSTLRQNILQPTSLSDLNLFNLPTIDLSDALNINNPLPSINDLFNARSSADAGLDNLDFKQRMSPSISNFRSALPPLQPLEDIHLDILQLKPLSPDLPTFPELNLNSLKTKMAMPESLKLKPIQLESSLGNKNGIIGASLTFGNDKKEIERSNLLQQASLKNPTILGSPLPSLPSLDDLRDAMWENTRNLLSTPLETTGRNVVEDTLRSGHVLGENLRVEAGNAMKDIQRNLKSTFKGAGLNNNAFLSSPSFRSPNDFFEELSRKHEDMNDKLKGIHYDLSDRLETLRNNILDDYRLPTLRSNIFDGWPTLGSSMPKHSTSNFKSRPKSSSFSSKGKKVSVSSDSAKKGKFKIGRTSSDTSKFKMPTAASITNLKTMESPKLRNSESPLLKTLGQEPSNKLFLPRSRPPTSILQKTEKNVIDTNSPFSKKSSLPKFTKNKVKISFSTTPLPPILKNRPRFNELSKPKSILNKTPPTLPMLEKSDKRDKIFPTLRKSASRDKLGFLDSLKDSKGYASEPVSLRVKAPLTERTSKILPSIARKAALKDSVGKPLDVASITKPLTNPLKLPRPNPTTLRQALDSHLAKTKPLTTNRNTEDVINQATKNQISKLTPTSWPKTIDDTFLLKVREALKARLAGISQAINNNHKLADSRKSSTNLMPSDNKPGVIDMAKSASNNIDVSDIGPEAMKENTSYSCKLTCTKNT